MGTTVTFDDFVVGRGPALLRFAYLLTHDAGLAEDVVQEALVKAHRRWTWVARADHPEAYVRRIVINEFLGLRRRAPYRELVGTTTDSPLPDRTDAVADRDLVWRTMAQLPQRQRAVLVLRYYEALTDAEIAATLDCAEGTVRSLASRAFDALRRHPHLADLAPSTSEETR